MSRLRSNSLGSLRSDSQGVHFSVQTPPRLGRVTAGSPHSRGPIQLPLKLPARPPQVQISPRNRSLSEHVEVTRPISPVNKVCIFSRDDASFHLPGEHLPIGKSDVKLLIESLTHYKVCDSLADPKLAFVIFPGEDELRRGRLALSGVGPKSVTLSTLLGKCGVTTICIKEVLSKGESMSHRLNLSILHMLKNGLRMTEDLHRRVAPSTYVIVPLDRSTWEKVTNPQDWGHLSMALHLVCEAPSAHHIASKDDFYAVHQPRRVLTNLAPKLGLVLGLIKGVFDAVPESFVKYLDGFSRNEARNTFIEDLTGGGVTTPKFPHTTHTAGAEERQLQELIDRHDKGRRYQGLIRTVNPVDGSILWLCEPHREELLPKSPTSALMAEMAGTGLN